MVCYTIIKNVTAVHLLNTVDTKMPIPKVPQGLKLTLMLPEDMVLRVKTEAVQQRTQPSRIVQKALIAHWGETIVAAPLSAPCLNDAEYGIRLTTRQKQAIRGRNLFALLKDAITMNLFAEGEFLNALGISASTYVRYWKPGGKVPANKLRQVHAFLDNYTKIEDALKRALRVPDFI